MPLSGGRLTRNKHPTEADTSNDPTPKKVKIKGSLTNADKENALKDNSLFVETVRESGDILKIRKEATFQQLEPDKVGDDDLYECEIPPLVDSSDEDSDDEFPMLSADVITSLSKDQHDLYQLCWAVIKGDCPPKISLIQLGKCCLARWLTPASRILRVYVSEETPSANLQLLAKYVVLVYSITWFEAKWNPRLELGPLFLLHEVQRQEEHFSGGPLEILQRYTQWNGFYAHEEQTLLYLACSVKKEDREIAVRHIQRIRRARVEASVGGERKKPGRKPTKEKKKVREYRNRPINRAATTVDNLINLDEAEFEPPLTMSLTDEQVDQILESPLQIKPYECISQFVERGVKATTEAAAVTTGADRQDAVSLNKHDARKKVNNIRHKAHFTL